MNAARPFWDWAVPDGDCLRWTGAIKATGYGQVSVEGRSAMAHRVAYELAVGPIPAGLVIDHLCRNRACVNPAHLEPVPQGVNIMRGLLGLGSHCLSGKHEMTPENICLQGPKRTCRPCRRARNNAWKKARRARRAAMAATA